MLEIRLFGRFGLRQAGKPIALSSRPAQSLLAYLVLTAGTPHRREKLAGMFWPDSLEENARDYLRHAIWRIRKALQGESSEGFLLANSLTVAFDATADYWLDAAVLEKVSEEASTDELTEALAVYQGELLPGFYDEWVVLEREHLNSIYEHNMARLMSLLQDENRWLDILDWGERWIKFGQIPEPAYRALMTAHAVKGDMSKVVAIYERCVKSLGELGIDPSEQTQKLYEKLKSGKEIPNITPVPTKIAPKETSSNVPVPLTSFVGREKELKDVAQLLSSSRLLTLTGPGGVGKTRIAIQTAHNFAKKFKDGVCWVGLGGLSDANLIPQEIARALNVREISIEPLIETLKTYLRTKDVLLVIDNCEHLIKACAQYAEQLLAACSKLKILATSIEALGIFSETLWQVPSLPLPELGVLFTPRDFHGYASLELFGERAGNAKPGFILDESNISLVAQICHRLDGIPLAIELAAARIKVLSLEEIAERLDDRFSLLTAGSRTAIPRHQTLRATIDWSHDLLTEPERILFRRLAVFAGGFTLEAVEAICSHRELKPNEILDLLGRLADKSLVIAESDLETGSTRYRLLETIRQYALEKLGGSGEARAIRDLHLEFYKNFAEEVDPKIYTDKAGIWFRRVREDLDNLRVATEWATNTGNAIAALQIAGSLISFIFVHGPLLSEWYDRIKIALARPEGKERTFARAKALSGIGYMLLAQVYPTEDVRPGLEEALSIGEELDDQWIIATALRNLGLFTSLQGNYVEARSFFEKSLENWREMGTVGKSGCAWTLMLLGDTAFNQVEMTWARSLYQEATTILREIGDINFLAYSVRRLGLLAWREGDYVQAAPLCKESLLLNQEAGDRRGMIACLAGFAAIGIIQGKLEYAAKLMAAVDTQLALIGIKLLHVDQTEYERNLTLLRTELDEKTLSKFWRKGKRMSLEQAIALALEEK